MSSGSEDAYGTGDDQSDSDYQPEATSRRRRAVVVDELSSDSPPRDEDNVFADSDEEEHVQSDSEFEQQVVVTRHNNNSPVVRTAEQERQAKEIARAPDMTPKRGRSRALQTCQLQSNSLLLDHEECQDGKLYIWVNETGQCYCPMEGCGQTGTAPLHLSRHYRWVHLDPTRPRFTPEEEYYQPSWLEGTVIWFHKPSNRAICLSTLILLLNHQIIEHIYCCRGCRNWRRPFYIPQSPQLQVSDEPINVVEEKDLPGGWYSDTVDGKVGYRKHELFSDVIPAALDMTMHADHALRSENRRRGNIEVSLKIQPKQWSGPPPKRELGNPDYTGQLSWIVNRCLFRMEQIVMGFNRSVAHRIGQKHWRDDQKTKAAGYWFGIDDRNQLDQLPYPLGRGVHIEAALTAGMETAETLQTTPKTLRGSRTDVQNLLVQIMQSIYGWEYSQVSSIQYVNTKDSQRNIWFDKHGRLIIEINNKPAMMPWFLAELLTRYMVVIRQTKELHIPLLFKNSNLFCTRAISLVRMALKKDDPVILGPTSLHALGVEEGLDWQALDQLVMDSGPCLVEYYQYL